MACTSAGPRTRLSQLYSPSANYWLYTEGLERLRRRQTPDSLIVKNNDNDNFRLLELEF